MARPGGIRALKASRVAFVVGNRQLSRAFEPDNLIKIYLIKMSFTKGLKYIENAYDRLPKQQR